jgi:hypothetical protein
MTAGLACFLGTSIVLTQDDIDQSSYFLALLLS